MTATKTKPAPAPDIDQERAQLEAQLAEVHRRQEEAKRVELEAELRELEARLPQLVEADAKEHEALKAEHRASEDADRRRRYVREQLQARANGKVSPELKQTNNRIRAIQAILDDKQPEQTPTAPEVPAAQQSFEFGPAPSLQALRAKG